MRTINQQNQTITKRIAHHYPQMKIIDNTIYDIHATFRPEVTEVMKELGG